MQNLPTLEEDKIYQKSFEEYNRYKKFKCYTILIGIGIITLIGLFLICPPVEAITIQQIQQVCSLSNSYPIGSIYTTTINENPNKLLGFGTWIRIGESRVLRGVDVGDISINQSLIEGSF